MNRRGVIIQSRVPAPGASSSQESTPRQAAVPVAIFTRPLDELAGHAAAFGNTGVFRELPPSHGDEAGKLTATFNRMAENLSTMMRKMEYSERRYRMLVELAQEGMVAIDAKGIINFVNDRFVDMMGYSREELLGRIYRSFVAPEYKETIEGELRNRQEGITGRYDSSLIRKDGVRIHVIISGTPLYDDGGKFRGAFCLMTDITDRRRAEERLIERGAVDFERVVDADRLLGDRYAIAVDHDAAGVVAG